MTPFLLWHLLANSTRRTPDQIAVIDRDRRLTYAELDTRSNQLARLLRAQGIGVGDRVGIYLDKSSAAIVSIFGILKAGAAYVPLDSKSPVARVGLMADDCRLAALVSDGHKLATLLPSLQFPPSCLVLSNDGSADLPEIPHTELIGWQDVLHAPAAALSDNGAIETDLAYILYTSGSTGRPKGVMISHRAALTFVNWAADYFQLKPDDRLSNHAPLHFDLSIFDLFAGLAASATVVLVPAETAIFPYSLAAWMAENRISVWYSVPSALIQLVLHGELESHDLSALRLVLFAGEVFPVQHLRRLQQMVPAPAYYNLYGPTETNVCTVYPVPTLSAEQSTPCPIGRACANMQVFALDEQGQEIGPDQIGELYVRGPDLMRGYWNLPDVTATVLLPNPLNPTGGEQVYRTGDLVRLDRDGNLVFVGRRDGMVKSRGYRIEVGEIEAVLYRHPGVAEAAVIPVVDEEIGHRLVGFVAPSPGSTVHSDELLAHCQAHLPAYMTPERIEVRSALPKTSTGKIDRLQLRSSETGQRRE